VNIINGFGENHRRGPGSPSGRRQSRLTGSAAVGKIIVKSAADTLKRVTLELAVNPQHFLRRSRLGSCRRRRALRRLHQSRRSLLGRQPILVEKKIYTKFVESMTEKAKRIKLGPPLDRETKMGPLVSKEQYDRVQSYLEVGKKEAKVAIGGGRPKAIWQRLLSRAHHFLRRRKQRRIAREEIFGPVASVIPSTGKPTRFASPTIRLTVWPPPSGLATSTKLFAW